MKSVTYVTSYLQAQDGTELTLCKTSHGSVICPQCQYWLHWITLQINNHEYQAHYKTCMQSYKSLQTPHMWNSRSTQLFQSKSVVSCVIASFVLTTKWRCSYQRMSLSVCRLSNLLILLLMQVSSEAKWKLNARGR